MARARIIQALCRGRCTVQYARCQSTQPAACAAIIQINAQGHPTGLSDVLHCFCATGDAEHTQPRTERVQKPQAHVTAPQQ